MKVILHESITHFKNTSTPTDQSITTYIKSHQFYHTDIPIDTLLTQIKQKIKKNNTQNNQIKNKLQQLSLYLNNQKNKSIFQIYSIVLRNPKGVTYKDIDKKINIGIVSVSHYCCRLKKMNFVGLKHQKNQKIVYPKNTQASINTNKKYEEQDEQKQKQKNPKKIQYKPFHFHQMSMIDNIWLNISSYESYIKNGITNQQIKQKLNKTSQTKLIMKMVDHVNTTYKQIDRQMVSQGKVFENRFKNITKQILNISIQQIKQQNQFQSQQKQKQKLNPQIQKWLKLKFPQYNKQKQKQKQNQKQFLLKLINNKLNDYLTVFGNTKPAKRTCTPIKLNRYIKILNSLNHHWPQTHIQLKNYIIDQEKDIQNGTMHKRSILGILQGLITNGILKKQQHQKQYYRQIIQHGQKINQNYQKLQVYYYPLWQSQGIQVNIYQQQQQRNIYLNKNKKNKLQLASLKSDKQIVNKIGMNQYKKQLKIRLIWASLQQIYHTKLKKALNRIKFTKRSKIIIKNYQPDTHIFSFLQDQNYMRIPKIRADNYQNFIEQLDQLIENQGIKQQPLNINYEVLKIFRKTQSISENQLKARFGNNWNVKLQPLIKQNLVEEIGNGIWKAKETNRYFI